MVSVGYNAAGLATTGSDWPLTAIAGAVIGGVSITGGEGAVIGAFIGMFLIGVVQNALVFVNVDTNYQTIILGFVIVLAVTTDVLARKRLLHLGGRQARRRAGCRQRGQPETDCSNCERRHGARRAHFERCRRSK